MCIIEVIVGAWDLQQKYFVVGKPLLQRFSGIYGVFKAKYKVSVNSTVYQGSVLLRGGVI